MSEAIANFFAAWQITDAEARLAQVKSAMATQFEYLDPRTSNAIKDLAKMNRYLGMFSANAPGWSAKLASSDTTGDVTRALVAFSGVGQDGKLQVQYGQYFVEHEGELISRMVGFVGTGKPE